MKYLVWIGMFMLVAMGLEVSQGQTCPSNGGFNIASVNISPWPPKQCEPQAVQVTGTFSGNYCVNQLHVHEVFNSKSYDQQIAIDQCFSDGQTQVFNWNVNPKECKDGNYQITLYLQIDRPQSTLACWTYSYTLN